MAGIDSLVNSRADMFAANPQGLQQRYAMGQDLLDLLALQKLKKDKEAAQRNLQMQMQAPQGTVKDQLEGQVMDMTKQEVAASLAPGIQQMGQRMAAEQAQRAVSGGLPTQPAPNMVNMARGGIVGYQEGGDVELTEEYLASLPPAERLRAIQRARIERLQNTPSSEDVGAGENVLRGVQSVRNMPSPAPEGIASVLSEGTPMRDIPVSVDALRRFDARREGPKPPDNLPELIAQMDRIGATPPPPRMSSTPLGPDAALSNAARYVGMMQNPPSRAREADTAGYLELMQRSPARRPAPPADAGIAALVPANQYQATDEDVAAIIETLPALQREAPAATPAATPAAPFRSRYEDRLAAIEAEKKDKMGALIDFLLAAGASGGTNLGATLMGGGSGLQARDARLEQEKSDVLKSIIEEEQAQQMMGFRERELAQQAALAREERASRENMGRTELAQRANEFKQQQDLLQKKFDEDVRQFGETYALQQRELDLKERADDILQTLNQAELDRQLSEDERKAAVDMAELLNSTLETMQLSNPEEAARYQSALNDLYELLGVPVGGSTASGDLELDALVEQYRTPAAR